MVCRKRLRVGLSIFLMLTTVLQLGAQTLLAPIGPLTEPADTEAICSIPIFPDPVYGSMGTDYSGNGPEVGDTIPAFQYYTVDGNVFDALTPLQSGKPLLLIAGSYTCPVFRARIPLINQIHLLYGSEVDIYIIYTIEAHPDVDVSPYFGYVNTLSANEDAGILYRQPTTYGERKEVASDMLDSIVISPPVLLDDPCNSWWSYFGPAPNNAWLIDTTGLIFAKHGWFNKYPDDIVHDLDSLLTGSGSGGPDLGGLFELDTDSVVEVSGSAGQTLAAHIEIENEENEAVLININRFEHQMPAEWASSMCIDICLAPDQDFTQLLLEPHSTQIFTLYFYTDSFMISGVDSAIVRIGFQNALEPANSDHVDFLAITSNVSTHVLNSGTDASALNVRHWPNPVANDLHWSADSPIDQLHIFNAVGVRLFTIDVNGAQSGTVPLPRLSGAGTCFAVFECEGKRQVQMLQMMPH